MDGGGGGGAAAPLAPPARTPISARSENTLDGLKSVSMNWGGNRRWAQLFVSRQR